MSRLQALVQEQRAGLTALVCIGVSVFALVLCGNVVMVCSQGWRSHVILHMHVALKHVRRDDEELCIPIPDRGSPSLGKASDLLRLAGRRSRTPSTARWRR